MDTTIDHVDIGGPEVRVVYSVRKKERVVYVPHRSRAAELASAAIDAGGQEGFQLAEEFVRELAKL